MLTPIGWRGSTLRELRQWPSDIRQRVGYELYRVQQGFEPSDWRPMSAVGPGVAEIRVHAEREYRVLYVARFAEAVYVLHVFIKVTPRTRLHDLELSRTRYHELVAARRHRKIGG